MTLPLVLLPGMNCSVAMWEGCVPGTGLGEVWTPHLTETSLPSQVQALLAALPARFVLAGLSLGGIVAMSLARTAPERVARVALLSTNAKAPTPVQLKGWADARARLAQGGSARELQADLLPALVSSQAVARDEQLTGRVLDMGDEVGTARLDSQLQLQATRVDERPGLTRLDAPCLVISGTDDALCPPAFHEEIAEAAPRGELVSVDAGHLSPMERPDLVGELIRRWVSGAQ